MVYKLIALTSGLSFQTFTHHQITLDDTADADALGLFPGCIKWIEDQLAKGNGVLVHCQAGMSEFVRQSLRPYVCYRLLKFLSLLRLHRHQSLITNFVLKLSQMTRPLLYHRRGLPHVRARSRFGAGFRGYNGDKAILFVSDFSLRHLTIECLIRNMITAVFFKSEYVFPHTA